MSCAPVADRASRHIRQTTFAVVALIVALAAVLGTSGQADAAGYAPRVVIVVGPSSGSTDRYLERAKRYAEQARAYGASVAEIYTPNATWARVVAASQGANLLVYLGHGNGWPSPYGPYQGLTKNGFGLNPTAGSGLTSPVKYYGEDLVAEHIRLAPGAVVLLNHLCYASGNGEPGSAEPSWDTARKRVDNYAAGFIKARARVVIADGHTSLGREIHDLFGEDRSVLGAWRADPDGNGNERSFESTRSPGFTVHLDPYTASTGFYRSIVTRSTARTSGIRIAALRGTAASDLVLRDGPSTGAGDISRVADGAKLWVTGRLRTDSSGRTWAPVITVSGARGFVAAWHVAFRGSAVTTTDVVLRAAAKTTGSRLGTVAEGRRVTVLDSTKDGAERTWLYVRTSSGTLGWLAGWLMKP